MYQHENYNERILKLINGLTNSDKMILQSIQLFFEKMTNVTSQETTKNIQGVMNKEKRNLDNLENSNKEFDEAIERIEQMKVEKTLKDSYHIETGHIAVTVKESLLEKAYEAGEQFVKACKKFDSRGISGPFALQGAIETDGKQEELVVFDVSFRMPGSPGVTATPYSSYLFGRPVSLGERVAMEVRAAVESGKLEEVVS